MLSRGYRRQFSAALLVSAAATALTGCSAEGGSGANPPDPAPAAGQPNGASGQQPVGVSPDGVTTRIDVPAQSTEEQYAQACLAAKEWITAKGGDPHTIVEPYLKELQAPAMSGPATFKKTWAELSDAQRAAVIVAVQAAADGGC
ncbi:MAG: lipoprotein LpqV [Mycobacterium sp.]